MFKKIALSIIAFGITSAYCATHATIPADQQNDFWCCQRIEHIRSRTENGEEIIHGNIGVNPIGHLACEIRRNLTTGSITGRYINNNFKSAAEFQQKFGTPPTTAQLLTWYTGFNTDRVKKEQIRKFLAETTEAQRMRLIFKFTDEPNADAKQKTE